MQPLEAEFRELKRNFQKQQKQIDQLQGECSALRRCLEVAGVVTQNAFEIELQKVRFDQARKRTPSRFDTSFANAALLHGAFPTRLLRFLDQPTVRLLVEVAPLMRTALRWPSRIYVIGGMDGKNSLMTIERHDPATGRWEAAESLPSAKTRAAAVGVGSKIYVIGGLSGRQALNTVDRFDPAENMWESLPPMETRRGACAAAATGQVFVLGGSADGRQVLQTAEQYDPRLNEWSTIKNMTTSRCTFGAVACGGKVYALGGSDGRYALSSVERFDPNTGVWQQLPPMFTARADFATATLAGKVYAIGGFADQRQLIGSVEMFDPEVNAWELAAPLLQPQAACAAATAGGRIYVFGGSDGRQASNAVQRLLDASPKWEVAPSLLSNRLAAVAVAVHLSPAAAVWEWPNCSTAATTEESDPSLSDVGFESETSRDSRGSHLVHAF